MDEETRLVIRVLYLAYLVQRLTKFCVFIQFSGHVNQLEIDVRESKEHWQQEALRSEFQAAYDAQRSSLELMSIHLADLKSKVDVLERILTEQAIPFDDLESETETIEHFYF